MPQPLQVALDALINDARKWSAQHRELRDTLPHVQRTNLGIEQFGYQANQMGLPQVYRELQERVENLINGGAETFWLIGARLATSASVYKYEDEQGMHKFRSIEEGPR